MEAISIYIHIPMCVKKCAYCDFTSFSGRMNQRDAYTDAVCREMREQAAFFGARRVNTVFFGGGTPTLMTGGQIRRIMDTLRACFDLAPDAEITMEGNPGTLSVENLAAYRAAGVNRLSLGVQSMDDGLLAGIGRIHTAAQAKQAVSMVREAGFENLNLDLMLGLPGQTAAQWRDTLGQAIALEPEHLSCYSLILEEGTPLERQVQEGTCAPLPDEDALCEMDDCTEEMTRQAGYARYEVSNYAKAGKDCRHNIVYWECLGIGCAAHSDLDGRRFYNPDHWEDYFQTIGQMKRTAEGDDSREERMFERVMMGLRMIRGMDEGRFERDFHMRPEEVWKKSIPQMKERKLMESGNGRLYLTRRGMQVMNAVLVEMLEETEG